MRAYYVKVHCYHPYKIEAGITVKASGHAIATKRALDQFRKSDKIKGRKVEEFFTQSRAL